MLLAFQFYPVCNFGKFINCGLGTVRSERVNQLVSQPSCGFVSDPLVCLFSERQDHMTVQFAFGMLLRGTAKE